MHAALVRERARPDIGLVVRQFKVGNFRHTNDRFRKQGQITGNTAIAVFELQIRDDDAQIRVAAPLADARKGALYMHRTRFDREHG
ncbi:hypothetical protein SDC9_167580 [bioreactor metagenome]|uniref:Uncharacterized protein n=1 Tax=bioreactor metagenome TaxID=1076179 RepID=A0A645G2N1_9ZZZZ